MNTLLNQINEIDKTHKVEENLYVKNIIVNKDKSNKKITTYVATEKWINQLGERLLSQNLSNWDNIFFSFIP